MLGTTAPSGGSVGYCARIPDYRRQRPVCLFVSPIPEHLNSITNTYDGETKDNLEDDKTGEDDSIYVTNGAE